MNTQMKITEVDGRQKASEFFFELGAVLQLASAGGVQTRYPVTRFQHRFAASLINRQYQLYWNDRTPVGFVNWAFLSDDDLALAHAGEWEPTGLNSWNTGDNLFYPELLAPYGGARHIVKHLRDNRRKLFGAHYGAGTSLRVRLDENGDIIRDEIRVYRWIKEVKPDDI